MAQPRKARRASSQATRQSPLFLITRQTEGTKEAEELLLPEPTNDDSLQDTRGFDPARDFSLGEYITILRQRGDLRNLPPD